MGLTTIVQSFLGLFNFESDIGYFYFYSALAQSMAAILGVVGLFAVYRLDIAGRFITEEEGNVQRMIEQLKTGRFNPISAEQLTEEITPEMAEEIWRGVQPHSELSRYADRFRKTAIKLCRERKIREYIKVRVIILAGAVAFLFLIASYLTGRGRYLGANKSGPWITLGVFCVTLVVVAFLTTFIYTCLAEKPLRQTIREFVVSLFERSKT